MSATARNDTGQYLDATGLLFNNARYDDSADTIVLGAPSLTLDAVAAAPGQATRSSLIATSRRCMPMNHLQCMSLIIDHNHGRS